MTMTISDLTRFSQIAVIFTKLLVVFWVMSRKHVQAQGSNPVIHQSGYCSMYAICGQRSDGKVLNCANTTASVKPDDQLLRRIQSLCPTISGNVCCTADQFDTLRTSVQPAIPLLVGCPACLRNFLNLFCEMSCSSNQSLFINVNSITKANSTDLVDGITYYITEAFSQTLYDSCKEVKFGSANSRAIDFIGNRARSYQEWFSFLGQKAIPGSIGSPYSISFITNASTSTGVSPMNATSYSCSDPSLGCSCGDCPSSPVCTKQQVPSTSSETHTCSVKIGKLEAQCVDLSMSIIFVVLACAILVWGFLKSKERKVPGTNSVVNSENKTETKETIQRPHSSVNDVNKGDTSNRDVHTGLNGQAVIGGNLVIGDVDLPFFQGLVLRFYRRYGIWIARYPVLILCSSVLVMALLCLGLMRFQVETRPEKLWVGPGSQAENEKQFFDSHLAPFYRIEQLIIATRPTSTGVAPSILTDENIQLLFEVQRQVDAIRGNYSGIAVSLTDICLKPMGTDCATQSVLQYYQMNPANYTSLDHLQYCFQYYSSNPKCLSAFQGPVDPSTILGGFSGSNYSNATVFVVSYPVTNAVEVNGSENAKAIAWEEAFIRLAKGNLTSFVESKNLTLAFSSESSIQRELERESAADVITIIISYIVMFVYISVTLGDAPRLSTIFISSKVVLGLSGVLLVMLSVLGSAGFFSAIGVKSTLIIMEVIPFLVLAVGVDNMCILVHAVKRQSKVLSIEERVSIALGEVGSSITLASLSEVLAFAVGSFIPMPAVRVFSMFAALAVLFDFFLQITAFTSLIVLDARRAESHRVDCFPCIKMPLPSGSDADGSPKGPGILQRYMRDVHAPILSFLGVKIAVLTIFIGFFFASIALCTRLDPGLEQQIALPRDSYLQGYFSNISEYLRVGPPVYFVVKNYNYSLEAGQTNKLCSINQCNSDSLLNQISRASTEPKSTYIAKPAASWLDDFLVWISPEAFSCCREFSNGNYCPPDDQPLCGIGDGDACKNCTTCFLSTDLVNGRPVATQFKEKLPWFLDALPSADCAKGGHGAYTTSIDLKGYEDGVIRASEFRSYHTPLNKQVDFVNALKAARAFTASISKSLNIDVFPYSVFYIFFEQYLDIWKTALIGIFVGLGAVFVVCLAFTSSFWTSAIILCVLAMVVLDLMGVMALLHVQLNAISVVNIIMSIGIAVEFCVHLTHSFVVHKGDREHRIREALGKMGASVFSGITLTKLVGVVVLGFARSQIFVIYYFQVYLALVLIGALHGLVFLPVLLSICGPPSRQENFVPPQEGRPGATR